MSILIFTEALATTGLGHLTRCTALAEILQSYGHDVLLVLDSDGTASVSKNGPPLLECHWKISENLMALLNEQQPTLCFVDSYLANFPVYEQIQSHCKKLICIDDDKRIDYPKGSTILNPSLAGKELDYDTQNHEILTGIEYVLLRAPFREDFKPKPIAEKISSILVTVGGEDRWNIVPQITEFLSAEYANCEKHIIVGPAFNNLAAIEKVSDAKTKILENLSALEMRDLMLKVDVAITGGGQTTYELVRCGVPMIVLKIAENQEGNIRGWLQAGIIKKPCYSLSAVLPFVSLQMEYLKTSAARQQRRLSSHQNSSMGSGFGQMIAAIGLSDSESIAATLPLKQFVIDDIHYCLVQAAERHAKYVFDLANSADVRSNSINVKNISWDEHIQWYNEIIHDIDSLFLVVEDNTNQFIGQVRISCKQEGTPLISISIVKNARGKGIARQLIRIACTTYFRIKPEQNFICAQIRTDNFASIKTFEQVGFKKVRSFDIRNSNYIELQLLRINTHTANIVTGVDADKESPILHSN